MRFFLHTLQFQPNISISKTTIVLLITFRRKVKMLYQLLAAVNTFYTFLFTNVRYLAYKAGQCIYYWQPAEMTCSV